MKSVVTLKNVIVVTTVIKYHRPTQTFKAGHDLKTLRNSVVPKRLLESKKPAAKSNTSAASDKIVNPAVAQSITQIGYVTENIHRTK